MRKVYGLKCNPFGLPIFPDETDYLVMKKQFCQTNFDLQSSTGMSVRAESWEDDNQELIGISLGWCVYLMTTSIGLGPAGKEATYPTLGHRQMLHVNFQYRRQCPILDSRSGITTSGRSYISGATPRSRLLDTPRFKSALDRFVSP